jgi:hypothetical protein
MPKRCFIGLFPITYLSLVLVTVCLSGTDLLAQSKAGPALRFGSSSALVQVAHNASFNSFPFTISVWFLTANASNIVQGIVSKYLDASGNGWTLIVQNGRLRGFHYRTFANYSIDTTCVAVVADGFWHHAAMTVDAAGGKLFLDGVQIGANAETLDAGGPPAPNRCLLAGIPFPVSRVSRVIWMSSPIGTARSARANSTTSSTVTSMGARTA